MVHNCWTCWRIVDKDVFSKSDPYLKIEFGGKHVRTHTIKNDRSPSWNETFHFKLNSQNVKDIHLSLKDDDFGIDDSIGTATLSRADLPCYAGEEKSFKVPILRKEQIGGIVYLRVKLIDGSAPPTQTNYQTSSSVSSYYPQSQNYSGPTRQPYQNQAPSYNVSQASSYYNQPQQPYYNQSQQSQPSQPLQQQQQPYYNQNQAPPMTNQPYQTQPQSQPQPQNQQSNINYPYNQFQQQRPY